MSKKQNIVKKIKSLCYLTLGGSLSYQFIYFKKDFSGYYDNVLQPLSQRLSPEFAHKIGVSAIKYGLFPRESIDDPNVLTKKNPPLLLKLAPDLSLEEMKDIVSVITQNESQVQGLIISNTTIDRSSLTNQEFSNETGGLSGKPLNSKSTEMIKTMYNLTKGKVPIIGVGGVFSGKDAYDKILAGASIVQIYTALIYHGPPVVSKIKSELADLLIKDGYSSVNDAIGKGVK
ncbi:unnamed protein product, partial [Iphiclides podalirius]